MSKQQTAVEWLFDQIPLDYKLRRSAFDAFQQAKAMEREQMFDFWKGGINCTEESGKSFDQYYNKTYGGEE